MIIDLEEAIKNSFEAQGLAITKIEFDDKGLITMEAIGPNGIIKHHVGLMFITRPVHDCQR